VRLTSEALQELISAFREGSQAKSRISTRDLFNERLAELSAARFDQRDQQMLSLIRRVGAEGLHAARARQREVASEHFQRGEAMLQELLLDPAARALAESFLFAQKAYLLYTQQQYPSALTLLERSFSNDVLLESQHGISILRMHRIQLLNNYMRVEAGRENWQKALTLGCILLQYLEDPKNDTIRTLEPPWHAAWSDTNSDVPADLLATMHHQIAGEEVMILNRALLRGAAVDDVATALRASMPAPTSTQVGRWAEFQLARIGIQETDYCSAASAIIRLGRIPSAPLWRSVADDVIRCLRPSMCGLAAAP
jgi:hypothetical protein